MLSTVGVTVCGLFTSVLTARLLGPEGRGLLAAVILIATLAARSAQLGLGSAFVYFVKSRRAGPMAVLLPAAASLVTLAAAALALLGTHLSSGRGVENLSWLTLLLSALMALNTFVIAVSPLRSDLVFHNAARLLPNLGYALALLPVLALGLHVELPWLLGVQVLAYAGVNVASIVWMARARIWSAEASGAALGVVEFVRYGLLQHGTVLVGLLVLNFDKLIALGASSLANFGFYALAFSVSRMIGSIQDALSTALFSRYAGGSTQVLSEKVNFVFRLTFVPMLLVAALGALLSPWVIPLLFGTAFRPVVTPFCVLLFECVVGGASWTLAQRFVGAGRPGLVFFRQAIAAVPVLCAIPFVQGENLFVTLSYLMLAGAALRLAISWAMYPTVLGEPLPTPWPTRADLAYLGRLIKRQRSA
ncbi:lipopolysaccharide biosynthesis protein [Sphaerotilus microaerophilus]|uniref:lipopolysaccharide biosynthesis protein n=1 Tax=Sphaerotilus microaerophilus TaxID=2914710 RepID=UPI0020741744|nr:oligosaccharide flippase family protein [Sphaerotilus sp. FB-5]